MKVNAKQPKVPSENLFLHEFSELLPSLKGIEQSGNRAGNKSSSLDLKVGSF